MSMISSFALALVLASTGVEAQSNRGAERAYTKCPGAKALKQAADVTWEPQDSRLAEHEAFRQRMNAAMPTGETRILFWSYGIHHTSATFSVVAVREADGTWRTSAVGETGPGLLRIDPSATDPLDRTLSVDEGRALDVLLADPCLQASPRFQRNPNIVAGGATQTIEIETEGRRWIASWFGVRVPQTEAIVTAITARADPDSQSEPEQ